MTRSDFYNADKRTEQYFEAVKGLRRELAEAWDTYEKRMQRLEAFKGSQGYEQKIKEVADMRDDDLRKSKEFYSLEFQKIIDGMVRAINSRKAAAPSREEMAIIEALRQRDALTMDEIEQAGRTLKNPLTLATLDEIAKKHGYKGERFSKAGGDIMLENVKNLAEAASVLCSMDHKPGTSGAELWAAHRSGETLATDRAIKHFRYDRDFSNEIETLKEFGGVEDSAEFSRVVNA